MAGKRKAKKEEETKEVSEKDVVVVSWGKNGQSREYSKELHGKDFKDIAKGFAKKVTGEVN